MIQYYKGLKKVERDKLNYALSRVKKRWLMSKIYKVAIIGGGFSGLVSAEKLSSLLGGESVLVLERNDRVGKKILATGNGRGNLSNEDISCENYHSITPADVSFAIEKYGNKSIVDYFNGLGMDISGEDGKLYPSSFQANSILDMLRFRLDYLKTDVRVNHRVDSVVKCSNGYKITADGKIFFCEKVIFACGGKAGKQYGTDGSAYALLQGLGHSVTPLYPSLVQLKTDQSKIKGLKGLKARVKASLIVDGREIKSFLGDILFTDYGISGNAIFYLSAYIPQNKKCKVNVEFLPDKTQDEIAEFLKLKFKKAHYLGVEDALTGVINKLIGRAILKTCGDFKSDERGAEIIARAIKRFSLDVVGTLSFDYAQVTKGGIPFAEINSTTMESKKSKGVYVVGEMLDVDGDCGGYNLQWAYSSASVACDGVLKNENR